MPSAHEAILATDCADLTKQLESERICNRNHLARIQRLNMLIVRYDAEAADAKAEINAEYAEIARLQADLDAARAGLLNLPY